MIISGLLVTLAPDGSADAARSMLQARPELHTGLPQGIWLPLAMEARDDAHARSVHDWILSLPGVRFVDVVSVEFHDPAHPHPQGGFSTTPSRSLDPALACSESALND